MKLIWQLPGRPEQNLDLAQGSQGEETFPLPKIYLFMNYVQSSTNPLVQAVPFLIPHPSSIPPIPVDKAFFSAYNPSSNYYPGEGRKKVKFPYGQDQSQKTQR